MTDKLPPAVRAYHLEEAKKLEVQLSDIQEKVDKFLNERNRIREQLHLHRKVLGVEEDPELDLPKGVRYPGISNPASARAYLERRRAMGRARRGERQPQKDPDISELGLRDAIRSILENADRGLRPIEITHELKNRGFQSDGKVELSVRVGNEVWRMAQQNHLKKRKNRYYLP